MSIGILNMEELIEKTKSLSWNDLSGLLKPNMSRAKTVCQASLVGRLVAKKIYPLHIIQPIICTGWRFLEDFKIEDLGQNRFLFTFASLANKERVLSQGLWNFKGFYMILREWDPKQTIDEVELSMVEFWVQIHGFPLEIVDEVNARLIDSKLGEVLDMDDIDTHKSFIRLKLRFSATSPLEPGFQFYREDGESTWIGFKYERLSAFCVPCRLIDHTIGSCYHNPSHPQNYVLTDKMKGFMPFDLRLGLWTVRRHGVPGMSKHAQVGVPFSNPGTVLGSTVAPASRVEEGCAAAEIQIVGGARSVEESIFKDCEEANIFKSADRKEGEISAGIQGFTDALDDVNHGSKISEDLNCKRRNQIEMLTSPNSLETMRWAF